MVVLHYSTLRKHLQKAMDYKDNLGYLLHHLGFVMDRQSDSLLQERLGIGFSQFKILMALKWHAQVQQRQIAEKLGQTEASVSRQIRLLKEAGLITVTQSIKNRREHITTLTTKGVNTVDKAMRSLNDYYAPTFDRFSSSQQEVLRELLKTLHQELCSRDKPGACHTT
jgi:DNA-binding MarR family transcriptional regulator